MSARTPLRLAADSSELRFGPRGELRESFSKTGRLHLDRWQPFIILHRSAEEASIGRRVALNCPSYLVWSPEEDAEAQAALQLVTEHLDARFGAVLAIELSDAPAEDLSEDSPQLPPLEIAIACSDDAGATAAAAALARAVEAIAVDSRTGKAKRQALGTSATAVDGAARLALRVPQIHRSPDGQTYPQLTHELVAQLIDAILCAAAAFMAEASGAPPPYFRSLGRSAFITAALHADKKLDALARSFDFLLSVSPINTSEARERFFASGEETAPEFRYRPLTVDPDAVKRDLYAIDLSILEDLLLERLLCEKRREIDVQLTMLAARNTPAFRPASMLLYGLVSEELLKAAHSILDRVKPTTRSPAHLDSAQVAAAARALVARYQAKDARFEAKVEVRDDVAGLLVSGDRLMIARDSRVARNRLDALLSHEVSVHLLTYFNGATQGLTIFRTGLAHYEGIQEGLGVFAEWAVGGLTPSRLRLLAGRVIAVHAMSEGASFVDVYRLLRRLELSRNAAFDIVARVFRSGGMAKDAIYLKGFIAVLERVAGGGEMAPFWLGKIAPEHVAAVEELLQRELLHPPLFIPEFLERDDTRERIAALRAGQVSLDHILETE